MWPTLALMLRSRGRLARLFKQRRFFKQKLADGFLDRLHEMGRFLAGRQIGSLLIGCLPLAVFEQCHALQRLIEHAPVGLETDFLGRLGAALGLGRRGLLGGFLAWCGLLVVALVGILGFDIFLLLASALGRLGFSAQLFAINDLT